MRSIAALAVVVVAIGACANDRAELSEPPPGDGDGRGDVRTVGVVGDSITVGAEAAIRATIEQLGVDVVAVDAESGRRLVVDGSAGSGVEAAARVAELDPDLWVVALGTNDVPDLAAAEIEAALDAVLGEIPDDAPLVWVDVYVGHQAEASGAFNDALRRRLDERSRTIVVEWADAADDEGVLRDGVHPSEAGGVLFARLVADGVAAAGQR